MVRTTNTVAYEKWSINGADDSNSAMCASQYDSYEFIHCNIRKNFELYLAIDCIRRATNAFIVDAIGVSLLICVIALISSFDKFEKCFQLRIECGNRDEMN